MSCGLCRDWCCPGCEPDDIDGTDEHWPDYDDHDDSWDGPADIVGGRGYTATGGVIL